MCNVCIAIKMLQFGLIAKGFDGKEYEFKAIGEKPEFSPVKWTMRPADQPWKEKWFESNDLAGTASLLNLDSPAYCLTFREWLFWKESLKELGYINDYVPLGKDIVLTQETIDVMKILVKNIKEMAPKKIFKNKTHKLRDIIFYSSKELTEKQIYEVVLFVIALNSPYNFRGKTDVIEKLTNAFPKSSIENEILEILIDEPDFSDIGY